MKLVLDDLINDELKEYLLFQEGITYVDIDRKDLFTILNIEYNEKTTPEIIFKYIELFQKNKYSILFEFDKNTKSNYKTIKYIIDDMCCEYCYKGLVMDLFENKKIKAVKSNFDYYKPAFNVEFIIEYDKECKEKEILEYIKEKYNTTN